MPRATIASLPGGPKWIRSVLGFPIIEIKKRRGHARKVHSLVPINTDLDLCSMGPDRRNSPPLTAKHIRDDIMRGRNGAFAGVATDFCTSEQ